MGDDLGTARFGVVSFDGHSFHQLNDGILCDLSVDLGEIGARMLVFRVKHSFDEFPVIGEEQRSFAVVIETSRRIHARRETELVERTVSGFRSELAEYAERLVEQDQHVKVWAKKVKFTLP